MLREYLKAWLPILGQTQGRIVFLDGFAGPGEYRGGEEGSPIIALKAFLDHTAKKQITAEVKFVFIEKKPDRATHLETLVRPLKRRLPTGSDVQIVCGSFDETMAAQLDHLESRDARLAPCFAMIDPFGVSDTPMDVISRILAHPMSEIYISVMYEHINRFRRGDEFEGPVSLLYGCDDWMSYVDIVDRRQRLRSLFDLYKRQLKNAGAEQVVHFDLYDRGQHKYSIFYASRHQRASNEMKAAIWSVDPGGGFVFRGGQAEQLALGVEPSFRPLRDALRMEFRGDGWVTIEEIEAFVMSDRTNYHRSQLRKHALIPMEHRGDLQVKPSGGRGQEAQATLPGLFVGEAARRRRRPTYPAGTEVRIY